MNNPQPPDIFSADCERVQDTLFSLMESEPNMPTELNAADQSFLDQHLLSCANCRMYRQSIQHLKQSLADLEPLEVPAGLEDRIIGEIAAIAEPIAVEQPAAQPVATSSHASGSNTVVPFRWKRLAPLAAAVMVVALAIPILMQTFGPQPVQPGQQVAQLPQQSTPKAVPTVLPADTTGNHIASDTEVVQPAKTELTAHQPTASVTQPAARQVAHTRLAPSTARNVAEPTPAATQTTTTSEPETDITQIASALPQSASQHFSDTYASTTEGDVYYDPVSTLVGF